MIIHCLPITSNYTSGKSWLNCIFFSPIILWIKSFIFSPLYPRAPPWVKLFLIPSLSYPFLGGFNLKNFFGLFWYFHIILLIRTELAKPHSFRDSRMKFSSNYLKYFKRDLCFLYWIPRLYRKNLTETTIGSFPPLLEPQNPTTGIGVDIKTT